jgi:hypothetical protein
MAREHGMIEPFTDQQVRAGTISYGVSSYGYDMRVADEFRIFTNALSAISLVGSIVVLGGQYSTYSTILGFVAVIASMINVVGGFLITDKMLKMFKPREKKKPVQADAEVKA